VSMVLRRCAEFLWLIIRQLSRVNRKGVKIDAVYLAAAKVGGLYANNTYPADFIYDNLMIECNVIRAAHQAGVKKLLVLGSSCIYPKLAPQPMAETALMTGTLEPTNEPYAVAKIAGIKLCESFHRQYGCDYRAVMPTSLYGPNDNFHPENSHVIPALMRRLHEAKVGKVPMVTIWGSGSPRREFMHVDDMADACVHVMDLPEKTYRERTLPMQSHVNIGIGKDCYPVGRQAGKRSKSGDRTGGHSRYTCPLGIPRSER